jgi:hypothetical protein
MEGYWWRRPPNAPSHRLLGSANEDFTQGMLKSWFYCENLEPSLPPFIGRLPEFSGTWSEEPTPTELPIVVTLGNRVNDLKNQGLTGVYVATHWLARRVMPLKKQVHPGWEYSGVHDPT